MSGDRRVPAKRLESLRLSAGPNSPPPPLWKAGMKPNRCRPAGDSLPPSGLRYREESFA